MVLKDWVKKDDDSYVAKEGLPVRVWLAAPYIGKSGKKVYEVWWGTSGSYNAEPMSYHYSKAAAHEAMMKFLRKR